MYIYPDTVLECSTIIIIYREGRLRHYLGIRYDSRSGVFDWDYHMKLNELVSLEIKIHNDIIYCLYS